MIVIRSYLLLYLLLLSASASAYNGTDNYDLKTFSGGLVGGVNLAQIDGDRYFGYYKPGITAGFFVRMNLTPTISIQTELLFAQKGSHGDAVVVAPGSGTFVAKCHIGLNYIEAPIILQYRYKTIHLEAGVSYGILVHTNEWIQESQFLYVDKENNRFNSTDLNYVFGISKQIYKQLHANIRFQYSILPIRPNERIPYGYAYNSEGQYNNLFSIRLLYML